MKKHLFALCALGALACAQEETNGASIGIGAAVQKGVFYTKDRLSAVPLPQIEAYYEGFYVRGLEVGYEHNFSENLFAGAYARFFDGWRVKSSKLKPQYRSVRDREHQTALGGKFGANFGGFQTFVYAQGGGRGGSYGAEASYSLPVTQRFSLVPAVTYDVFSRKLSDYYFGTDVSELGGAVTSVYNPGSSYALGARATATYEFNNGFGLSATAGARRFSDEVARSPIVRSRYESVIYTGVSYKF